MEISFWDLLETSPEIAFMLLVLVLIPIIFVLTYFGRNLIEISPEDKDVGNEDEERED